VVLVREFSNEVTRKMSMGKAARSRETSAGLEAVVPRRRRGGHFGLTTTVKGMEEWYLNAYVD
jgi:hypothetical protein